MNFTFLLTPTQLCGGTPIFANVGNIIKIPAGDYTIDIGQFKSIIGGNLLKDFLEKHSELKQNNTDEQRLSEIQEKFNNDWNNTFGGSTDEKFTILTDRIKSHIENY